MDDTLVIQKAEHSQQLLHHINSQDPYIQFTVEEPGTDGFIPFLDTKVTPGPNNTILTTVYRKLTHTDQYLHWDSNHFITAKNSVYNTLAYRTKVVSSTLEDLNKELGTPQQGPQGLPIPQLFPKQVTTTVSSKTQPQQQQQSIRGTNQQEQGKQQWTNKQQHFHSHTIHTGFGR